jgi:hypothetical protein
MLDHSVKILAEFPAARRACTVGAETDDALTLFLHFDVLFAQIAKFRVGVLAIAHLLGAPRLEISLRFFQLGALFLELDCHFLFLRRSILDYRVPRTQTVELFAQCMLCLSERLSPSFLTIHLIEYRELIAQLAERFERTLKPW